MYQRVLHELVAALEHEGGMDSGVFSALAYLERAEPAHLLRMGELQRLLHPRYSQPGFSRLITRMEVDGLVTRTPDPDDGRAAVITSTPAGRDRYQQADLLYAAEVQRHFGRFLSTEECRVLVALMGRVGEQVPQVGTLDPDQGAAAPAWSKV